MDSTQILLIPSKQWLYADLTTKTFETSHEKTNNVSEQVLHEPSCTVTEDG